MQKYNLNRNAFIVDRRLAAKIRRCINFGNRAPLARIATLMSASLLFYGFASSLRCLLQP